MRLGPAFTSSKCGAPPPSSTKSKRTSSKSPRGGDSTRRGKASATVASARPTTSSTRRQSAVSRASPPSMCASASRPRAPPFSTPSRNCGNSHAEVYASVTIQLR
eukprot:2311853-Prymnesium_polylepis.3